MLKIKDKIKGVLPSLSSEQLESITSKLADEIGVGDENDLKYVREEDLASVLKPIQCRRLIQAWKQIESHASEEVMKNLPDASSTSDASFSNPNLSSDWVEQYLIPWHKMSCELTKAFKEKRRLEPKGMREFVSIVSKSVHTICPKPGKANLKLIARQAKKAYPASFSDVLCGERVAGGYESLTRTLVVKFENMNRRDVFNRTKKEVNSSLSEDGDEPPKRKLMLADQYGCINWQLSILPEGETSETQEESKKKMKEMYAIQGSKAVYEIEAQDLLKRTYYSQRVDINTLVGTSNLLNLWPLLFTDVGLLNHFKTLVGVNLKNKLQESMGTKGKKIVNYFKNAAIQTPKIKELIKELSDDDSKNSYMLVIFLLMEHFLEKRETIFKTVECSVTPKDIESICDLPATPCLIICGDDINSATFMLVFDKKCINEDISTFNDGLMLLFAAFYNFNLQYTAGAECTLEFIQRCFLGINPDKGTKANKKKKTVFNNKVLTFIEKLMYFEWCD